MNWVDLVLIGTLATCGLLGMWIGMIRASFSVLGVIAGFVVVAYFRGGAVSWLAGYVANEKVVDVLSFAIVISATAAVTVIAAGLTRRLVYGMFMGWADRLAGMTAGLAVGAALAAAVVLGTAGLSYADYSHTDGVTAKVLEYTPYDSGDFSGLEARLTESDLVSILVSATDIIPDKAFDVVPEDWREALDLLERHLDRLESAHR